MVEQISSFILKRRKLILAFVLILSAGFGYAITRLEIVTDFEAFFLPDDPDLQSYAELKRHFGSDEFILLAYEAQSTVFTTTALKELDQITKRIQGAPNTATTLSLTNAKEFRSTKDGIPVGMPIVDNVSMTRLDAAIVKAKIEENPFYDNLLVSEDNKTAFIVVQMRNPDNENFVRLEMTRTIEEAIAPFNADGKIRIAGTPIYLTELYRLIVSNLVILGGAAALLVVVLLWLSIRSLAGIVLPIMILILSVVWNMGIFGATGAPLTIASSVVVPLIVAISVTNSIHFLLAYTGFLNEEKTAEKALLRTMTHIIPPAFFSSFTTAVGFLTLTSARVLPVVQTGLYTAAGVMASFVLTITVIPIVLSYYPKAPAKLPSEKADGGDLLSRVLDKLAAFNLKNAGALVIAWIVVAGAAGAAISMIRVETNPLTFFREGSRMQRTHAYFEEKLGGTLPFEMIVQGKKDDFKDLRNYANLNRLENYLESIKPLHGVIGTPDLMREIHNALSGEGRRLPYDGATFSGETRLIDLARNQYPPVNQFIDRQWSQARFTSRVEAMSSADLEWLIRKIDAYTGQKLDPRFEYKVTGIVKLLANMIDKVRDSQVASLALAIVLLWICFIVFLRSALLGTLAMLPNVIPIVTTLGLMGLLNIELDLATVMMPSIAIGLAVDDTLHFFNAFRARALVGDHGDEAVRWTLHFRGRAFLYTSFVLAAGFGILLLSDLRPVADFGIISCAAIGSALLADLLLNPALLKLAHPKLADWSERQ